MFYIVAKKFEVSVHEGRAWIKYYGTTSVRLEGMQMHCITVSPSLRQQAEAEARKQEDEFLKELLKENRLLQRQVDDFKEKEEAPAEQKEAA